MNFSYEDLSALRARHPAWRLLCSHRAPLIISFLHQAFVVAKVRSVAVRELAEALETELRSRESGEGSDAANSATDYLEDWASPDKGWLRKFYRPGTDEVQFDLTPAAEKAIAWLGSLTDRAFVGTESRLLTLTTVLKQMVEGTETDPRKRIEELRKRREELDQEIAAIEAGDAPILDEVQLLDRWQHFEQLGLSLLHDFREVEDHFRRLDRRTRERVAANAGPKAGLLDEILSERDAIRNSEQGRSFRSFFTLLMSARGREDFATLLDRMLGHPVIRSRDPDPRIAELMTDCLTAASHTQSVARQLSEQLQRLLESGALTESRRITELLHGIETHALAMRDSTGGTPDSLMEIELPKIETDLVLERPLFTPPARLTIRDVDLKEPEPESDLSPLFTQTSIDQEKLRRNVAQVLTNKKQVTLTEVISAYPLTQGLAELVSYLHMSMKEFDSLVDEDALETITWTAERADGTPLVRSVRAPRLIFTRKA